MLIIILLAVIGASACWWILSIDWRNKRRRKRIMSQPFPSQWRKIIKHRLPFFRGLPDHLKLQLKKHIQVFIAEKEFIGCDGQQINYDVKVTIAAQACLLLLNKDTDYYPKLKQILIYPSAFYVDTEQSNNGLVSHKRRVLLGESWEEGKVVLSWPDTLASAADPTDGSNLIFHEFAHQLDQQTGVANGAPILSRQEDYQQWSEILNREYERVQLKVF